MEVKRKEGESASSLIYRFSKRIRRSGIIREVRANRFHDRPPNKNKRKRSALHRIERRKEYERKKKLGIR